MWEPWLHHNAAAGGGRAGPTAGVAGRWPRGSGPTGSRPSGTRRGRWRTRGWPPARPPRASTRSWPLAATAPWGRAPPAWPTPPAGSPGPGCGPRWGWSRPGWERRRPQPRAAGRRPAGRGRHAGEAAAAAGRPGHGRRAGLPERRRGRVRLGGQPGRQPAPRLGREPPPLRRGRAGRAGRGPRRHLRAGPRRPAHPAAGLAGGGGQRPQLRRRHEGRPHASLDDGLLDVVVIHEIGKLEFLRTFPKVFSGRHVEHPAVAVHRAARRPGRRPHPGRLRRRRARRDPAGHLRGPPGGHHRPGRRPRPRVPQP